MCNSLWPKKFTCSRQIGHKEHYGPQRTPRKSLNSFRFIYPDSQLKLKGWIARHLWHRYKLRSLEHKEVFNLNKPIIVNSGSGKAEYIFTCKRMSEKLIKKLRDDQVVTKFKKSFYLIVPFLKTGSNEEKENLIPGCGDSFLKF